MIKAILFDMDDTLYDLAEPFKKACDELFPEEVLDKDGAFIASRKYSDEVFELSQSGQMSMEDMYVYRIQNAFCDFGKYVDRQTALTFQQIYQKNQRNIRLSKTMTGFLEKMSRQETFSMGVITNGPAQHQWDKIERLGIDRDRE